MGLAEGGIPRAEGCSDTPIPGEPVLPQNCCEPVLEGRGSPASVYQDVSEEEECIVTLWASKGQEPVRRSVGPRESGTPPTLLMGFLGGPGGKEHPPANAGGLKDTVLLPGSGGSPGGGHGSPLQYSCLENQSHGQRSLAGYSPWRH